MKAQRNTSVALFSPNLGARQDWVVSYKTWLLYTQKRISVPTAEKTGWAPGPVQTNVVNRKHLNPTGV
jgi:hypothetical protein